MTMPATAESAPQAVYTAADVYVLPLVTIDAGSRVLLTNVDLDIHGITSEATTEDGQPLFTTPWFGVTFSTTAEVDGVETLPPGDYPFFCTFHAEVPTMHGTLTVR
jgi:plastocyanin